MLKKNILLFFVMDFQQKLFNRLKNTFQCFEYSIEFSKNLMRFVVSIFNYRIEELRASSIIWFKMWALYSTINYIYFAKWQNDNNTFDDPKKILLIRIQISSYHLKQLESFFFVFSKKGEVISHDIYKSCQNIYLYVSIYV